LFDFKNIFYSLNSRWENKNNADLHFKSVSPFDLVCYSNANFLVAYTLLARLIVVVLELT